MSDAYFCQPKLITDEIQLTNENFDRLAAGVTERHKVALYSNIVQWTWRTQSANLSANGEQSWMQNKALKHTLL